VPCEFHPEKFDSDVNSHRRNTLISTKETQTEADTIPKHELLDQFLSSEFDKLTAICPNERELPDVAVFDAAFRQIIAKA